jgi:hypothetical protein
LSSAAATEESTPPDMATTTFCLVIMNDYKPTWFYQSQLAGS